MYITIFFYSRKLFFYIFKKITYFQMWKTFVYKTMKLKQLSLLDRKHPNSLDKKSSFIF